jgi:hypothetical protein
MSIEVAAVSAIAGRGRLIAGLIAEGPEDRCEAEHFRSANPDPISTEQCRDHGGANR